MKKLLLTLGIFCILVALGPIRKALAKQVTAEWTQESMTYLPDDISIKKALLGFETTLAHYLWIRTVIYFGSHHLTDRSYPWIINMLDIITKLSPDFYPAYEFGGLMVPEITHNPEAARILLERGITHLGNRKWHLAFYLGMLYYKYYDDRHRAAETISRAAFVKGAPQRKLISLAQALYTRSGSPEEARGLLLYSLQISENPEVRAFLTEKLQKLPPPTSPVNSR